MLGARGVTFGSIWELLKLNSQVSAQRHLPKGAICRSRCETPVPPQVDAVKTQLESKKTRIPSSRALNKLPIVVDLGVPLVARIFHPPRRQTRILRQPIRVPKTERLLSEGAWPRKTRREPACPICFPGPWLPISVEKTTFLQLSAALTLYL